jgi:uncharacterized protein (DUF2237 family)
MHPSLNVLGLPLESCSESPLTGWYRDGCCNTDNNDRGSHTVCAVVTQEFLDFLRERGNDLITPAPHFNFPGLKEGDQWCVCAASWRQAYKEGKACKIHLESTHYSTLRIVPLEELMEYSLSEKQ